MSAKLWSAFKIGFPAAILALFLLAQSESRMAIGTGKSPRPLWEIDLSKFGYQGRPPVALGPADTWGFWTYQQGAVFTESNVVAVFFVVHDYPSGAVPGNHKPSPSDLYRLVAVLFDANRGAVIKQLDWPLPIATQSVSESFFFPATNGRFIVGIADTLSLYSPHFELLARYEAPQGLEARASPAGDTILVQNTQRIEGKWISRSDLLDTHKLSVLKSWEDRPQPTQSNQSLWGDELAWILYHPPNFSLNFKTPDTAPKQLLESKKEIGNLSFINKETIAVVQAGGPQKLLLVSTDGKILQEFDFGLEAMDGPIIASRNGRRFAVPTYEWGSARNVNPERLTARVFSVGTEKPLLTLNVPGHYGAGQNFHTPLGDTRFGWGGLALSPDAKLLAIKSGPAVQLYEVPEPGQSDFCSGNCNDQNSTAISQPAVSQPAPTLAKVTPSVPPQLVQQALSWLPADTETVIAANGPFLLPELKPEANQPEGRKEPDQQVEDTFESLPLVLFGFKHGLLEEHFKDARILLAIEGSRHFRSPSGLGEAPFEGCAIAVFTDDISGRANSFMRDSSKAAVWSEQIEGQKVAVFQEKLEQDTWTTFVAFPKPDVAAAASNKEYLREVLARLNGKSGERALPNILPEWKHVDVQAKFWAVRHYDKKGTEKDPTSPYGDRKAANLSDPRAVGLTFYFDPGKSNKATVTYLSGDESILQNVQKNLFPVESEPGARELDIRYHQVEPGIVEGSYDLSHIESAELFVFALEALLGHVIFL